jgi:acetolactate synthase-1/2/3 large subunit
VILAAERPLVMLGAATSRPRLAVGLTGFFRRTRLPFFNTQMGKGTVAGGGKLYMGTAALSERDYVHEAIDRADLILSIGHDTIEKPPFIMGPAGPKVIHVGYTPANVEQVFFPHAEVVGDVGPGLALLADRLEGRLRNAGALTPLREGILARIADRAGEGRFPPTPQRIVHDVRQVMPRTGSWRSTTACTRSGSRATTAPGWRTRCCSTTRWPPWVPGLPSAMMAAMLYPERRVLAVCGDGGFMMNSQEMETAVRLKLEPGGAGAGRRRLRHDPLEAGGGRLRRLRHDLRQPGLRQVRRGLRRQGPPRRPTEDLVPTLEAAFRAGGVHLVAVPVDYSENSACWWTS